MEPLAFSHRKPNLEPEILSGQTKGHDAGQLLRPSRSSSLLDEKNRIRINVDRPTERERDVPTDTWEPAALWMLTRTSQTRLGSKHLQNKVVAGADSIV